MNGQIRVVLISQDRVLRADMTTALSGWGSATAQRSRRSFAERLRLLGAPPETQSGAGQPWILESAPSIDEATDLLDNEAARRAAAYIVVLDLEWEYEEDALLFALTVQALSESAHLIFVSAQSDVGLRSQIAELGEAERCSFLRKPVAMDELVRLTTSVAWPA